MQFLLKFAISVALSLLKKALWEWPKLFGIQPSSRTGTIIFWTQLTLLLILLGIIGVSMM